MNIPWPLLLFIIGFLVGGGLMVADSLVGWKLYQRFVSDSGRPVLLTRSLIFLAAYWPLALFVTTTATNSFGQGLVLGMGSVIGWEMWRRRQNSEVFKAYFGIASTSRLTSQEIKLGVVIWNCLIVLFTAASLI